MRARGTDILASHGQHRRRLGEAGSRDQLRFKRFWRGSATPSLGPGVLWVGCLCPCHVEEPHGVTLDVLRTEPAQQQRFSGGYDSNCKEELQRYGTL
jgi:hypothetical protein